MGGSEQGNPLVDCYLRPELLQRQGSQEETDARWKDFQDWCLSGCRSLEKRPEFLTCQVMRMSKKDSETKEFKQEKKKVTYNKCKKVKLQEDWLTK